MAHGINKVILVGNLGADPETRHTGSGSAVTSIRIATSESWTDKQTGEKQERTEWHRITMFSKLGEIAAEYLRKGSQVYIEGSLRTSEYEKDGVKRYSTDIVANEMQMLGGRSEGGGGGGGNYQRGQGGGGSRPGGGQGGGQSRGGDYGNAPPRQAPAPADSGGFDDDDIPF